MNIPIPWKTGDIVQAAEGGLLCGDRDMSFPGISIDSRTIQAGDIYVAIKGNTHDGHKFIPDAVKQGAAGLIIERDRSENCPVDQWQQKNIMCISVADTTKALGDLAAYQRRRSNASVIAITGSNGKTTTRGITAAVVARRFNTLSTEGNYNNEIGLPLTLFKLSESHDWAVLELGMNHFGEIQRLARICGPNVGIITNIGPAHLEGVGSIEGVRKAKGELLDELNPDGTAVLNADDPNVLHLARETSNRVLFFGFSEKADVRAESITAKGMENTFDLVTPDETIPVSLKIPGDFMILNALAAAAAGHLLGISAEDVRNGIESFSPQQGRMNIINTKRGVHIIDDTYNANPDSMEASISALKTLKNSGRSFFVAGDMHELGDLAEAMHKKIGSLSARHEIARLYAEGKFAGAVADGARAENMPSKNIFIGTGEEIIEDIKKNINPGDWILVKGSRAMGMEKIVRDLRKWGDS